MASFIVHFVHNLGLKWSYIYQNPWESSILQLLYGGPSWCKKAGRPVQVEPTEASTPTPQHHEPSDRVPTQCVSVVETSSVARLGVEMQTGHCDTERGALDDWMIDRHFGQRNLTSLWLLEKICIGLREKPLAQTCRGHPPQCSADLEYIWY